MTFTPHISVYQEGEADYSWFGDNLTRATLIFSKHLEYNKFLARKRINIHLGDEERIHTYGSIKSIWVKYAIDTSLILTDAEKVNTALKIIFDAVVSFGYAYLNRGVLKYVLLKDPSGGCADLKIALELGMGDANELLQRGICE